MVPREAWVTEVPFPGHGSIVIVSRVERGCAGTEAVARRLIATLLASIALERLTCHVAIIDGELAGGAPIFGTTPDVEIFVRSMLDQLTSYAWRAVQFDYE